jgi:hypothetical protein
MLLFARTFTRHEMERRYGVDRVVTVTGQRGTAFFADTSGLHASPIPTSKPRLMLEIDYSLLPIFLPSLFAISACGRIGLRCIPESAAYPLQASLCARISYRGATSYLDQQFLQPLLRAKATTLVRAVERVEVCWTDSSEAGKDNLDLPPTTRL